MSDEPALERRPASLPPRWGLGDAVGGYALAFGLNVSLSGLWVGATGRTDQTLGLAVVAMVAHWSGLVGAVVLASRLKGRGRLRDDFGLRLERRDLLPGVAIGVGFQFLLLPLLYLPVRLLDPQLDLSGEARRLIDLAHGPGLVLLGLCVIVGAPLAEELFFRGLLQRALARRFGAGWAVAGSSLAFGLIHYQLLQLLGLVALGVALGMLAQLTGRLGPSVVTHMAFNAATFTAIVFFD